MKKIFLCVLSAILIILSFPKTSFWFLSWISLVPLFLVIQNEKPRKAFVYGTLTGFVAYCGILYWLIPTFSAAGEPKIIGIIVLLLLALYLASYYGIFCFLYSLYPIPYTLYPAFVWVSLEFLRTHLFTGFPWALLGYSQWNFLPIIQISEFTGIYGVSFLIIFVNLAFAKILIEKKKTLSLYHFITLSLVLFSLIFGLYKLKNIRTLEHQNIRTVSILQGNIDQYKKWDEKYEQEIIDTYTHLSISPSLHLSISDLIVWPESAVPGYLRNDLKIYPWISQLAKKTKTQHLVASIDFKHNKLYNSAFLVSADGQIIDEYSKNHLVPFGEYIPLRNFLGKFIKVVNEIGEFSADKKYNVINSSAGKLGVNICFEAIFANEIRKSVKNGAEIIVNLTNDGWYLKTSAPYQHFTMNVFRAVENRRYVVRAANTGISCFIEPSGRIKKKTEIFTTTTLTDSIQPINYLTFYTSFGDIFAYFCIIILIITCFFYFFVYNKK